VERPFQYVSVAEDVVPVHRVAKVPIRIVDAPSSEDQERRRGANPPVSAEGLQGRLPLAPPNPVQVDGAGDSGAGSGRQALTTVGSSLAVVLGIFGLFVWVTRRSGRRRPSGMPGNIVETLGRTQLNARQEMQLVRVGNKLLLLSVTATTAETLTEITDPDEIDRLTLACHNGQPDSLAASFRGVLSQLRTSPPPSYTFSAHR
jgi:flagellar biogenesis protein FliO